MKKRWTALGLVLVLCLGLTVPASAHDMGRAGQWNVISAGCAHSAAVDENGVLWTWGYNSNGQLGDGTTDNSTVPVRIMEDVVSVSCGSFFTAAIKTDGSLWMWGNNEYGQLGNGGGGNGTVENGRANGGADYGVIQTVPVKVMDNVAAVNCDCSFGEYTAAIKTDGTLWTWGKNLAGQLGDGSQENSSIPVKILDNVTAVSCGIGFAGALRTDGSLWMWGFSEDGRLFNNGAGNDTYTSYGRNYSIQTTPVKVMDGVAAFSCAFVVSAAVKANGTLWICGGEFKTPVRFMEDVAAVYCGGVDDINFVAPLKTDGSLWLWAVSQSDITEAARLADDVAAVTSGGSYIILVKSDGSFWAWGENVFGALGNAAYTEHWTNGLIHGPDLTVKLPVSTLAHASTQNVQVDGKTVEFQCYALKDENGNDTNYIKLRDVAQILNGTAAQFEVTWDGAVNIVTGQSYTANGSEMKTPFSGNRIYTVPTAQTKVNGAAASLDAIVLTDGAGNGYTYYKLRDLGDALGFTVDWSAEKGIFIETDKP